MYLLPSCSFPSNVLVRTQEARGCRRRALRQLEELTQDEGVLNGLARAGAVVWQALPESRQQTPSQYQDADLLHEPGQKRLATCND